MHAFRVLSLAVIGVLYLGMIPLTHCATISAAGVVKKVDEIRNPQLDYIVHPTVKIFEPNKQPRDATFDVYIKGQDKTFIKQLSPVNERDRLLLMRERAVWAFFPKVSKPLRISLQERLTGDVAIGDIARANFSNDYSAKFLSQSSADAAKYFKLELTAITNEVTYGKVILWALKSNYRPVKAEFYAVSGRLLKTCTFEEYRSIGGGIRPTKLVMTDAVVKEKKSIVTINAMKIGELPEKYFTKDYMKKLQN